MKKINWAMFPHRMPNTLCVGEEKTLTEAEVKEINIMIGQMFAMRNRLDDMFGEARKRFANRYQKV